ncbi:MAG: hypothetical protein C4581_00415 [Nitrospiraceae bacterium]|nr:MAG: hypothetical protein C4581_00415 [Nitrospiraceae bacterium]
MTVILDMRGIPYKDAFMQIRDAVNADMSKGEVLVFCDSKEYEKCMAIKGFAEILLGCKTVINEAGGFYMIRIIHKVPCNAEMVA